MTNSSFIFIGIITAQSLCSLPSLLASAAIHCHSTRGYSFPCYSTPTQRRAIVHLNRHLGPAIMALTPWWAPTRMAAQVWLTLQGSVRLLALVQPCVRPRRVPLRAGGGWWLVVWHFKASSYGPASALHVGTPCAPAWAARGEAWSCSSHLVCPQAPPVGLVATRSLAKASEKYADIGLCTPLTEIPQLNGALEKSHRLNYPLSNSIHGKKK